MAYGLDDSEALDESSVVPGNIGNRAVYLKVDASAIESDRLAAAVLNEPEPTEQENQ